jgi:hypothetical protein
VGLLWFKGFLVLKGLQPLVGVAVEMVVQVVEMAVRVVVEMVGIVGAV